MGVFISLESLMSKISKYMATAYRLLNSVMPKNAKRRLDRRYELPDLFMNFRRIYTWDRLDISQISFGMICKATRARKIDATKFSDLY